MMHLLGPDQRRSLLAFTLIAGLLLLTAFGQSWSGALDLATVGAISAVMALGLNMQWGYAGLFNAGLMGFAALGALATVLVSMPPVFSAWGARSEALLWPAGPTLLVAWLQLISALIAVVLLLRLPMVRAWPTWLRYLVAGSVLLLAYLLFRALFDPAVVAVERSLGEGTRSKYLGGLGLPIGLAWGVGGLLAAAAASLIGRITLGLRADYLAIATLGISEIVIAALKNEGWLTRGTLNVNGLPPITPEVATLQAWGLGNDTALIVSKLLFLALVLAVLGVALWASTAALKSPWGRMMRAIRDREDAASAMGKNVVLRHRQVFVLGSFLIGLGGAMLATKVGQFTPGEYQPLRYTFLIWVMVIVGGSGNNLGSVVGAMLIWFVWVQAEPVAGWLFALIGDLLGEGQAELATTLQQRAPQMRTLVMGLTLLLVLRFAPRGILPEVVRRT